MCVCVCVCVCVGCGGGGAYLHHDNVFITIVFYVVATFSYAACDKIIYTVPLTERDSY